VPSSALELALFVESERMAFSLERFSQSSLRLEREIVAHEARLRFPSAASVFPRHVINSFFGDDHPYFRPAGADTSLDEVQLSEVQAFFQQGYRPDNAHLVLVGDFVLGAARAQIERYFGPIVAPTLPRKALLSPRPFTPARAMVLRENTSFEQLNVSWVAPDPDSLAGRASDLFARQLRKNLQRALVEEAFAVTRVQVGVQRFDLGPLFFISLTARQRMSAAAVLLKKELTRTWACDWTRRLPSLRREHVLSERIRRESLTQVALDHLVSARALHRPFDFEARLEQLHRVDAAAIRRLSAWFTGKEAMVALLLRVGETPAERVQTGLSVTARQ
jgi:predicted Zn-dependent peptidase